MLQNATPLRKSAPSPPNLWWTCLLYCASHAKCIFEDPLQMSHACHRFWKCYKTLTFCSLLTRCTIPYAYHAKAHLNVQKCSVPVSFLHFWLGNVLRATTACTFSSLIWPAGSAAALASLLATFLPFRAPGSSFFWDFLFLLPFSYLTLPISAFHLSILSEVWLLNFLRSLSLLKYKFAGWTMVKPPFPDTPFFARGFPRTIANHSEPFRVRPRTSWGPSAAVAGRAWPQGWKFQRHWTYACWWDNTKHLASWGYDKAMIPVDWECISLAILGGAKSVESCGEHDKKCGWRTGHQQNVHCGMDRIGYIVRCIHIANPRINLVDPSPGPFQTMAVKDGSGPRPAAHTAKRCFLNWLESSFRPSICLPSCTASCQLACLFLQLAFFLRRSGEGTVFLASNLLASSCSWLRSHPAGPKHHGSEGRRACGRQPILPNVAFWTA